MYEDDCQESSLAYFSASAPGKSMKRERSGSLTISGALYVSPCYLEGGAYGDGNLPSSHRMVPADGLSVQAGALHTGRRQRV